MESEKRKLIKFSNYSLCVTLPKWVVLELKWKKGDLVNMDVDAESGKITISSNKKSTSSRLAPKKITEKKSSNNLRW